MCIYFLIWLLRQLFLSFLRQCSILMVLVMGSLNSLLREPIEGPALFSLPVICCIYKVFNDKPDVVCKLTPKLVWPEKLNTVHKNSFCYTKVTWWFMKCQTLLPLKNSDLHICLIVLISVVLVTLCPHKLCTGSESWGKWMEGCFPLFKEREQTYEWEIRREWRASEVFSYCWCTYHTS